MKVSETDPRVIRTRALLRNTLMALVAEKRFASLTIQDVTHRAGLHRTTFYLHYTGLHELLEDCTRALFSEMRVEIYKLVTVQQDSTKLEPAVESVFRHLEKHETFYRAMLGRQGEPFFRELFQEMLSELIFEPIAREASSDDISDQLGMTLRFYSAGFAGIASWWLEKHMAIPVEQAASQITRDILPSYLRLMRSGS